MNILYIYLIPVPSLMATFEMVDSDGSRLMTFIEPE